MMKRCLICFDKKEAVISDSLDHQIFCVLITKEEIQVVSKCRGSLQDSEKRQIK